ncbi:unnamed protein product, partial [Iphiclides podalirius]
MSLSSRMYTRSPNFCFLICHLTTPATYLAHIVVLRPNHHVVDKQTGNRNVSYAYYATQEEANTWRRYEIGV